MAEADAEHWLAFVSLDLPVNSLAMLVIYLSAKVGGVDHRLFSGCELVSDHLSLFMIFGLDQTKHNPLGFDSRPQLGVLVFSFYSPKMRS
jgi:hypothetical protein